MSIESEEYHIASGLSDASIIIGIVLNSPKAKSLLSRFTSKSLYTTHIYIYIYIFGAIRDPPK